MKFTLTISVAAVAMVAGSMMAFADDDDRVPYRDLYELKQLHVAFHKAVSHAGRDAATKAQHLADVLAVSTDDGTLLAGDVAYSGKGTPGTASCDPGTMTLCDLYTHRAAFFVLGHDWVSLTPIFTEAITVLDRHNADIYFQCIYLDVTTTTRSCPTSPSAFPECPAPAGRRRSVAAGCSHTPRLPLSSCRHSMSLSDALWSSGTRVFALVPRVLVQRYTGSGSMLGGPDCGGVRRRRSDSAGGYRDRWARWRADGGSLRTHGRAESRRLRAVIGHFWLMFLLG
jgi:hypothetical protein